MGIWAKLVKVEKLCCGSLSSVKPTKNKPGGMTHSQLEGKEAVRFRRCHVTAKGEGMGRSR